MKNTHAFRAAAPVACTLALLACFASPVALAGSPVTAAANQLALLQSADPQLAANKKLVFDFWREVLEAGHFDNAERYLSADYIQHNPNIADGRAAFVNFFKPLIPSSAVQPQIQAPLVSITAEGSLVILVFVQHVPAGKQPAYTTSAFDMFRVENGKIVEHWDGMLKR